MSPLLTFGVVVIYAILALIPIAVLIMFSLLAYGSIISRVPFVPVKRTALKSIIEALELTGSSVLYDLGSGEGRVINKALESNPSMRAIGLEIAPWPRLLSHLRLKKYGGRATIKNESFFNADFSDATHIYVYLFPEILSELEPLFDSRLAPGTRVVSCDFVFPTKTPDNIIDIPGNQTLSKKLMIYTW